MSGSSSITKRVLPAVLAVAGAVGCGVVHARGAFDVQWSVHIPGPVGISISNHPRGWAAPVVVSVPVCVEPRALYGPPVVYVPAVRNGHYG